MSQCLRCTSMVGCSCSKGGWCPVDLGLLLYFSSPTKYKDCLACSVYNKCFSGLKLVEKHKQDCLNDWETVKNAFYVMPFQNPIQRMITEEFPSNIDRVCKHNLEILCPKAYGKNCSTCENRISKVLNVSNVSLPKISVGRMSSEYGGKVEGFFKPRVGESCTITFLPLDGVGKMKPISKALQHNADALRYAFTGAYLTTKEGQYKHFADACKRLKAPTINIDFRFPKGSFKLDAKRFKELLDVQFNTQRRPTMYDFKLQNGEMFDHVEVMNNLSAKEPMAIVIGTKDVIDSESKVSKQHKRMIFIHRSILKKAHILKMALPVKEDAIKFVNHSCYFPIESKDEVNVWTKFVKKVKRAPWKDQKDPQEVSVILPVI